MRIGIEKRLKDINHVIKENTALFGEHKDYRPVKNVDYEAYTLFMSTVAHDYKRLGIENFLLMYDVSKHRGIKKRYLKGFIEYIAGIERHNTRKGIWSLIHIHTLCILNMEIKQRYSVLLRRPSLHF